MAKWSDKDERQYEHIKENSEGRGVEAERAEETAARTVNETRRQKSRTPDKTTQGTGNPTSSLEDRTKEELYNRAQELGIEGCGKMDKSELLAAIRDRR